MLDIEQPDQLLAHLRGAGRIGIDETPLVRVLAGGVSNRTVFVSRENGDAWVLKQALDRLRVETEWRCSPERILREAAGMRRLAEMAPPGSITPLLFVDPAHHLLAMQAVPEPHENWKAMLLAGRLERGHVEQFARLLGTIHREAFQRRAELEQEFGDRSFFEALRLEPYYAFTATQVPAAAAFLAELIEETRSRRDTLVHGDYSPKNVLVHENRLVLLDHEVIHFGDAAFDLGFSLTHLLSKAHHLVANRDEFVNAAIAYWQTYLAEIGDAPWRDGLEHHAVRHTLACLLARVAGRSPLEYLSPRERIVQRDVVLDLIANAPRSMELLVENFADEV